VVGRRTRLQAGLGELGGEPAPPGRHLRQTLLKQTARLSPRQALQKHNRDIELRSRNRFTRSLVPVGFAIAAVAVQIVGLLIEPDDPKAFGDNIGGMLFFVPAMILLVVPYWRLRVASRL
jgi:hypothetical protein